MVLMAVRPIICGILTAKFTDVAGAGFAYHVRNTLFYKIQDFSFANIDHFLTPNALTTWTAISIS